MPTVPIYKSQVSQQPLPNMRVGQTAPIEAFGGGQAQQKLMSTALGVLDEEKKKADQVAFMDADTKLSALQTRLEFDPNQGFQNRKGKDAFSIPEDVQSNWDKGLQEIEQGLSNDDQKLSFRKSASGRWSDLDRNVQRHVSTEITKYDTETTDSYIKNEENSAVANYKNPDSVNLSIQRQQAAIVDHGTRNGLPEELVKQKIAETTSKTQSSVVTRMLNTGEYTPAAEYYKANKDSFVGQDSIQIERALEEGSVRGQSQKLSDDITTKTTALSTAVAEVKKIQDPKVRDATMDRVKSEFSLRDAAKRDREENDYLTATNILEKGGTYDSIPPAIIARMPLGQRSSLRTYMTNKESDLPTYYNLKTMAATPDLRDKFLQTNLLEYAPKLSRSDMKDLMGDQAALRKGNGSTEEKLDGFLSDKQVADEVAVQAGIHAKDSDSEDKKQRYAKYLFALNREQSDFQRRTGKKATSEDMKRMADNLVIKGVTEKGTFYDDTKLNFEAGENQDFNLDVSDIPRAEFDKIRGTLKARGLVDSDTSILRLYQENLKRMRRGNK